MSRDSGKRPGWAPGRRQLAAEWYAKYAMRYFVGPGVMLWELLDDKGRDLAVLIIGFMLASSTDVLSLVRGLVQQAKFEKMSVEELISKELLNETRKPGEELAPAEEDM